MTKIQYLHHQADKADRLARDISDPLTVERLASLSREYRENADALASTGPNEKTTDQPDETPPRNGN